MGCSQRSLHLNDMAVSETIVEAASRPMMRFFRSEDRGAADAGHAVPDTGYSDSPTHTDDQCPAGASGGVRLGGTQGTCKYHDPGIGTAGRRGFPAPGVARETADLLWNQVREFDARTDALDRKIQAAAREDEVAKCLRTIPGLGTMIEMFPYFSWTRGV